MSHPYKVHEGKDGAPAAPKEKVADENQQMPAQERNEVAPKPFGPPGPSRDGGGKPYRLKGG